MIVLLLLTLQDTEEIRQAFREGRHSLVVDLCDRALPSAKESRAEILFWKGTSLARLERHLDAVEAIDEALALGFSPSEAWLEKALSLHSLGRREEAEKSFEEAERLAKDDPERLDDLRRRWKEATRTVEIRVTALVGYDTNLLLINEDARLLQDVARSSFYYGAILSARAILVDESSIRFFVDLQEQLRGYAQESDFSFADTLLSAVFRSRFDWVTLQVAGYVGESWLFEDGHYRTQRGLVPTLAFHPGDDWRIRVWGEGRDADYYDTVPEPQDRDGRLARVGIAADVEIGDWKLSPAFSFGEWDTDGSDYDHYLYDWNLTVTTPQFWILRVTATVGYVKADFKHENSITNFREKRDDQRFVFRLLIKFPDLEREWGISPAISISYEKWNSDIRAWDFDRWDIMPSVEVLALSF